MLYTDTTTPAWARYQDTWTTSEPESDPSLTPPAGYLQPIRGFGKIWRTTPGMSDRLGWAIGPEVPFSGAYQVDTLSKYNNFYLRAADQRIIHLWPERSGWDFLAP